MTVEPAESTPRYEVALRPDVWVEMADGVRLAGNLYLPTGAGAPRRCPGILTMIPYHKDGRGGFGYLDPYHRSFAARGYAVLHLDLRGTGNSEGVPYRTLDGRERGDGYQAVEWMAAQPWCTGQIGAWGISYGGITALAIAETRPPHLRAIVPVHAPDDNHEAMIVHRGARLMFWPDPHWGAGMVASNLMPPLRRDERGEWQRLWRERLAADPWILDWYGDPSDPHHWSRQRVDTSRIAVPTYVICGWQDAYPDSVHEYWAKLDCPKRLLFGPWKHVMPERANREAVDTLTSIHRWWDRWLAGIENGIDRESPVTIFVQGSNRWREEPAWPPSPTARPRFVPQPDRGLADADAAPAAGGSDRYRYDARAGLAALPYDACTGPIPYPQDQSADDYLSLTYTSAPLTDDIEVVGVPAVRVAFTTATPLNEITLVAKLCDVAPSGESFLVTFEHLAGERAEVTSAADGTPLYQATLVLRPTAYRFAAGHRLRLALSGANFPYLWPSPAIYEFAVEHAGTELTLPVVGHPATAAPGPVWAPPPDLTPLPRLGASERYWTHRDETSRAVSFEGRRLNTVEVEPGTTLSIDQHFTMAVDGNHPAEANTRTTARWRLERAVNTIEIRARTLTTLHEVEIDAEITLDGYPYWRREWRKARSERSKERESRRTATSTGNES